MIELLAAIAIFATALTGILGFLATGVITIREVDTRQTALEEALRQVEDIKNLPYDHSIPVCSQGAVPFQDPSVITAFYTFVDPINSLYGIDVQVCTLERQISQDPDVFEAEGIQIITATVTFKGGEQVVFEDYKADR